MSESKHYYQTISLDGHQIFWLDASQSIPEKAALPTLHPDEQSKAEAIKSPVRRAEFERSRILLRQLTGWQQPFLPDPSNRPSWPPGFCGSLTHKNGHVAVVTAPIQSYSSIGIDCEDANKDIKHLIDKVCTTHEKTILESLARNLSGLTLGSLVALIFCAKEALFKCHYPLGLKMFWFHDAELEHLDLQQGHLVLKVLIDTSPKTPTGFLTSVSFTRKSTGDTDYWLAICGLPSSTASASATTGTT